MDYPKQKTVYEWDVETWDEHDDIQDHAHSDKLEAGMLDTCTYIDENNDAITPHLVLVRDVWELFSEEDGDLKYRDWAYVKDGKLPEEFMDGIKVPKRFHEELARVIKNAIN